MPLLNKLCYRCRQPQPPSAFIQKRNGASDDMCSSCLSEILTRTDRPPKTRLPHTPTTRICYLCRRQLPNAAFTRRSNGTYISACKACNVNVFAHRRPGRLAAAEGTFTTAEWEALKTRYAKCPGCERRWEEIRGAGPVIRGTVHPG
jgi:hypothetical protein